MVMVAHLLWDPAGLLRFGGFEACLRWGNTAHAHTSKHAPKYTRPQRILTSRQRSKYATKVGHASRSGDGKKGVNNECDDMK